MTIQGDVATGVSFRFIIFALTNTGLHHERFQIAGA